MAARLLLSFVASALGACSAEPAGDEAPPPQLTCSPRELRGQGWLNGANTGFTIFVLSYSLENKLGAAPGKLSAQTTDGGLLLEFESLIRSGESSAARGNVTYVGRSYGNCETGPFASKLALDADGGGVHFELHQLHQVPYCSGSAAKGTFYGCLGFAD